MKCIVVCSVKGKEKLNENNNIRAQLKMKNDIVVILPVMSSNKK